MMMGCCAKKRLVLGALKYGSTYQCVSSLTAPHPRSTQQPDRIE